MASSYYSIGSKGDEVKKIQSALSNAGYNVGSSGADGIYGKDTAAAVSAYQKAKGLAVDGIAGVETLGSLYKPTVQIVPPITPAIPDKPLVNSGPTNLSSLKDVKVPYTDTAPLVYKSPYEDKMNSILDKYLDFDLNASVDPTKLPEYGALKQQYDDTGASAYNNQIGRLSSMTGGRPSTAAVGAASQSQNAYAKDFAGTVIPGLISNEQNRRQNVYDNLANQLKMLQGFDDISYGRGRDAISDTRYADETTYNRGQDTIRNTGTMTVDNILATIPADSPLRNTPDFSTAIANEKDPWVKAQLQALRMEKINADPELKAKYGSTMEIPTYLTQDAQAMEFDRRMAEAELALDTKYKNEQIANIRADNARAWTSLNESNGTKAEQKARDEQYDTEFKKMMSDPNPSQYLETVKANLYPEVYTSLKKIMQGDATGTDLKIYYDKLDDMAGATIETPLVINGTEVPGQTIKQLRYTDTQIYEYIKGLDILPEEKAKLANYAGINK